MKLITTTAIALVAALAAAPAAAQYTTPSAPQQQQMPRAAQQTQSQQAPAAATAHASVKPSAKALKALVDLQKAVDANDTANIPAKVAAAEAVASTKEDHYLIGEMRLKAALAAKDYAAMGQAIDAIAASGYESPADTAKLYMALGSTLASAKQYDLAVAELQKGAAIDPRNSDILLNLGETRVAQGQPAQAVQVFQRAIQLQTAAGQKPEEALYKRAVSIAYDAKLPEAVELGRQWAAAYPSAESWRNSLAIFRNQSHQDVEGTLDVLRLMQAAGALSTPGDYMLFAESAADQGNFNEAQAVIDQGIAAKVVNPTSPEFRDIVGGLKTKSKASVAELEAAEKAAQNGSSLVHIGDRYYGMGQYAKAAELYRKAVDGADSDVANLHLGMALARSGDKAGAAAAFNAVTGARAEIAKFWLAYLQQKA